MDTQEQAPAPVAPESIDAVIADLINFGLDEIAEPFPITVGKRKIWLKFSNITSEDDIAASLAAEGQKNYVYFLQVKLEIMARSITYLNGIKVSDFMTTPIIDPTDGLPKDIRAVLRSLIRSWGTEVQQVLWKLLMVHSQKIEDSLYASFPEAALFTDVERRIRAQAMEELEKEYEAVITDGVTEMVAQKESQEG
jgi:hypothetical protein